MGLKNKQLLIVLIFMGALIVLFSQAAAAQGISEVKLLNIDGSHMILYWYEWILDPYSRNIKVQTTSDGGITWLSPKTVVSIDEANIWFEDFDGIRQMGNTGRLLLSTALGKQYAGGREDALLIVRISEDYGLTWNLTKIALNLPNVYFTGCPVNTTQYDEDSGVITMTTTVAPVGTTTGYIYVVISRDGGITWEQHRLAQVSANCIED